MPDEPEPAASPWAPLGWAVGVPCAVFLVGSGLMLVHRATGGCFLLLWPLATVGGMALGTLALLRRLFAGRLSTPAALAAAGAFAVGCLGLQAALAVWLASVVGGGP